MKLKIGVLTIVLIVFALIFIYQTYDGVGMVAGTDKSCKNIETKIYAVEIGSLDEVSLMNEFVSCIQHKENAKIRLSMNILGLIIFIFLGLLSWKFDKFIR